MRSSARGTRSGSTLTRCTVSFPILPYVTSMSADPTGSAPKSSTQPCGSGWLRSRSTPRRSDSSCGGTYAHSRGLTQMRRAPIVIGATVAGLVGVLAFHTKPAQLNLSTVPAAGPTQGAAAGASSGGTPQGGASPKPAKTAQQAGGAARTATGPGVNYNYGVISVKVTVSGRNILNVGVASIDDG